MRRIGNLIKILAWTTDRIDQFSAFLKKRFRLDEIKQIDGAVDRNDAVGDRYLGEQLRKLEQRAEDRKNTT